MKNMSKKMLLSALLIASVGLTGCQTNGDDKKQGGDEGTSEVVEKTFADLKEEAKKEFLELKEDSEFKDDSDYITLCEEAAEAVSKASSKKKLEELKTEYTNKINELKLQKEESKLGTAQLIEKLAKQFKTTNIKDIRKDSAKAGEQFVTVGQVVGFDYTDQSSPRKKSFYLTNGEDSMCIYAPKLCEQVSKGDVVVIKGQKGFYIPEKDVNSAEQIGYRGQLQLNNAEMLFKSAKPKEELNSAFVETSVDDILNTKLSEDITGKIYKVKGIYHRHENTSYGRFVNYELEDLRHTGIIQAYTQCNGKELTWTDKYDGKTVEMLICVTIAKPGRNLWKMTVVDVLDGDYKVSGKEIAKFAAEKINKELPFKVFGTHENTFTLPKINNDFEKPVQYKFSSSNPALKVESLSEKEFKLTINEDAPIGELDLDIETSLVEEPEIKYNLKHVFEITKPDFESKDVRTINDVRTEDVEQEVILSGVVSTVTFKANMIKQGFYLIDETGSTFVYADTSYLSSIKGIEPGQKLVIKGKYSKYIPGKTPEVGYTGNIQITEPQILDQTFGVYEIPQASIKTISLSELAGTPGTTNISGETFKVSLYCKGGRLYESKGSSETLRLYSQTGFADYRWLEEYDDTTREFLVCVHDRKNSSGTFKWRFDVVKPVK